MEESNAMAVRAALAMKGVEFTEEDREVVPYEVKDDSPLPEPSEAIMELLTTKPRVINVGVESFNDPLRAYGAKSVQYTWKPMAGGNKRMIHLLTELAKVEGIDEANERICQRFKESQPQLVDVGQGRHPRAQPREEDASACRPPDHLGEHAGPHARFVHRRCALRGLG